MRPEDFGIPVSDAEQPALWALIREIAERSGAVVPDYVVLTPDVNAHAIVLGGLFRRKRKTLALGLGLFSLLPRAPFGAVIAHELGHLTLDHVTPGFGGLPPDALVARLAHTHKSLGSASVEEWVRAALTEAHAYSRERELAADQFALAATDVETLAEGLVRVGLGTALFQAFMQGEVFPVLAAGRRPRELFSGFRTFVEGMSANDAGRDLLLALRVARSTVLDTHPALSERLQEIDAGAALHRPSSAPPFRDGLNGADALEAEASRFWARANGLERLPDVAWTSLEAEVYAPALLSSAEEAAATCHARLALPGPPGLDDVLRAVLDMIDARGSRAVALRLWPELEGRDVDATELLVGPLAGLLFGVLLKRGGRIAHALGGPVYVALDDERFDPQTLALAAVRDGPADLRAELASLS